eukprot:Opistho-1_new@85556
MSNQSQGIQALLSAEKAAAETVSKARKQKTQRLKAAKDEAESEIARFKAEREAQFRTYLEQHAGTSDTLATKLKQETVLKIATVEKNVAANKEAVINRLLEAVCDVKPQLHVNVRAS